MNASLKIGTLLVLLILGPGVSLDAQTTADTFGSGTNTFMIDFTEVGNPGNGDDSTGFGGVSYTFRIGVYEISQDQITAATNSGLVGVTGGDWTGSQPASGLSWYEAAMFVNWLNTSTGHQAAYNFSGTSMSLWSPEEAWQQGGENLFRHKDAYYFLPGEDEWYKAAYYDGELGIYYDYPTGSDMAPTSTTGGTAPGTAVFGQAPTAEPADVDMAGGLSPYGTMGQGGNVWEILESAVQPPNDDPAELRVLQGGAFDNAVPTLSYQFDFGYEPYVESNRYGFRVASVPEPSCMLLVLAFGSWAVVRRRR